MTVTPTPFGDVLVQADGKIRGNSEPCSSTCAIYTTPWRAGQWVFCNCHTKEFAAFNWAHGRLPGVPA